MSDSVKETGLHTAYFIPQFGAGDENVEGAPHCAAAPVICRWYRL